MALTTKTNGVGWTANFDSSDLTGCETLHAAPSTGTHYLDAISISNGATAQDVTIGEGESGSAVESVLWGPIRLAANQTYEKVFRKPIALTAGKDLTVDSSAAGAVTVGGEGYNG